jgi:hypothetical protein
MIIAASMAAYLIIYVVPRYRFPIEPFFIVLAAMTVDWLATQGIWSSEFCAEIVPHSGTG